MRHLSRKEKSGLTRSSFESAGAVKRITFSSIEQWKIGMERYNKEEGVYIEGDNH